MENRDITWTKEILIEQLIKFKDSNKKLSEIISNENNSNNYSTYENFHLIDHDWLVNWKEKIFFEYLSEDDNKKNLALIERYVKKINIQILNNKNIYYNDKKLIDPMKTFDLISNETWELFDKNNTNSEYKGKVTVKEGYKKIIIVLDENNYSVKYLTSKKFYPEFIIVFNPNENKINKNKIIDDVLKKNIFKWMQEIQFKFKEKQFTINKYGVIFKIIQKSNNYIEETQSLNISTDIQDISKYVSLSKSTFSDYSVDSNNSFMSSNIYNSFLKDIGDFRIINKYNNTSHICSVMRCLSMVDPFADYFMSPIKGYKVFSKFNSLDLLNLIGDYFRNILDMKDKNPYAPKDLIYYLKKKEITNIKEEQDTFKFLDYILDYINKKLNKLDYEIKSNFNNISDLLTKEQFYPELVNIVKKTNSIESQCFYGLMLETYNCYFCKSKFKKIKILKILDLNLISIYKHFERISDSIIQKKMDDLLEFYFLNNKICTCKNKQKSSNNNEFEYCPNCNNIINTPFMNDKCEKCKNYVKIEKREILEYPSYLIIRLNIGEFREKEGFINSDELNYNIKYNKIKDLKSFTSKKNKNYNEISNYKYSLINSILYSKIEQKIKFHCICKSPLGLQNQNVWISFVCNNKPKEIEKYNEYYNVETKPIILFYKLEQK